MVGAKLKKIIKRLSIVLSAVLILRVVGGVVISKFIDGDFFSRQLSRIVYEQTGRRLIIEEVPSFSIFPNFSFKMREVTLSNPTTFKGNDYFMKAEEVGFSIKLIPLLTKKIEISRVTVKNFSINLIASKSKQQNWVGWSPTDANLVDSANLEPVATSDSAFELAGFSVDELKLSGGKIVWLDEIAGNSLVINGLALLFEETSSFGSMSNAAAMESIISDLNLAGIFKIESVVAGDQRAATDLVGKITVAQEKVKLELSSGCFYDGQINGWMVMSGEPSRIKMESEVALEGLSFDKFNQKLTGKISTKVKIAAKGATYPELLRQLNGEGFFTIADGAYRGIDIPYEIKVVSSLLNSKVPPAKPEVPATGFEKASFTFKIAQGVAYTDDFLIEAADYQIAGAGAADLIKEFLDFSLTATAKRDQNLFVPVKIIGKFSEPSVKLDVNAALGGMAKRVIKNQLKGTMQAVPNSIKKLFPFNLN